MLHLTVSPWPRIVSYGDSAYLAIALEGHGYRVACSEAAEILGNESVQEITWLDDVLLEMQILGSCAISFWVTFAVWICISILPDFKNPYSDRSSTARAFCRCSFWSCVFYCVSSVDLRYHDLSSCPALSPFFKSFSPFGLLQSIVDSNRDLVLWILEQCVAINAMDTRQFISPTRPKFEDTWQTKKSCCCQPFWSLNCVFGPLWRALVKLQMPWSSVIEQVPVVIWGLVQWSLRGQAFSKWIVSVALKASLLSLIIHPSSPRCWFTSTNEGRATRCLFGKQSSA